MKTVGVDTSLTTFSLAPEPSSKSRSTIAQLYGVDTHAARGSRAIAGGVRELDTPVSGWTARPDWLIAAGESRR